jgi:tetratricopeptide (TPR) repeat protein
LNSSYEEHERDVARALREPRDRVLGKPAMLLAADPGDEWTPYVEGLLHVESNDRDAALNRAKEALRRNPQSPLARALVISLTERGEERVRALQALVEEWPSLALPRRHLAFAHLRAGQTDTARLQFASYTARAPEDPIGWMGLALACIAARDRKAAAEAARRLEGSARNSPFLRRRAAQLSFATGHYATAWAGAWRLARDFRGWRNRIFPITLPVEAAFGLPLGFLLACMLGLLVWNFRALAAGRTSESLLAALIALWSWVLVGKRISGRRRPIALRESDESLRQPDAAWRPVERETTSERGIAASGGGRRRVIRMVVVMLMIGAAIYAGLRLPVPRSPSVRMAVTIFNRHCESYLRGHGNKITVETLNGTALARTRLHWATGLPPLECRASFAVELPSMQYYRVLVGDHVLFGSVGPPGYRYHAHSSDGQQTYFSLTRT